jgi:PIN domain nuclease of toxin-antitoxin system
MILKNKGFLLDTHTFLWIISDSRQLSSSVKEILQEKDTDIYLSKISYWEICLKASKGKIQLNDRWQDTFEKERTVNRFQWLELEPLHCEKLIKMEWHHKDPFDRILVAQALTENLSILSRDEKLRSYEASIIW